MHLYFATGNQRKFAQLQAILDFSIEQITLDLPEPQAVQVKDVIEFKAREAYRQVGKPVLVEDTGLYLKAWNDLPGALIRWFLESVGNEGICKMMAPYDDLRATAETCVGYFDGTAYVAFSGMMEGEIVRTPRGNLGFGWDAIFSPDGWDKTFAEMTPEETAPISMRRKAVVQLRDYLANP